MRFKTIFRIVAFGDADPGLLDTYESKQNIKLTFCSRRFDMEIMIIIVMAGIIAATTVVLCQ